MPKLKTKRGATKRFRKTANSYKHRSTNRNHILTKKKKKCKTNLRSARSVKDCDKSSVKEMLTI